MEINHKGRGFMKSKLAKAKSFLKPNSKPSMPVQCNSNKVSPSPYSTSNITSNSSSIQKMSTSAQPSSRPYQYTPNYNSTDFPTKQPIHKVSTTCDHQLGSFQEYCGGGDENVDLKTASYISYVRQRFSLEKVDTEAW